MTTVYDAIAAAWSNGRSVVLVSVIDHAGSVPRGVGAQMVVGESGLLSGTIGGGILEKKAIDEALLRLKSRNSGCRRFELRLEGDAAIGMICGGELKAHFLYLEKNAVSEQVIEDARRYTVENRRGSFIIDTQTNSFRVQAGIEKCVEGENCVALPIPIAERVVVFGAGHVSQALVPVLASVGFRCVVMENRIEYASPEHFPQAERVIHCDYGHIDAFLEMEPDDYAVVMTHGHTSDLTVLKQLLQKEYAYVGVMGSAKKVAAVNEKLREAGISDERIAAVHTPIGINIGAVTPEEIAISIAAECIRVRAIDRGVSGEKVYLGTR